MAYPSPQVTRYSGGMTNVPESDIFADLLHSDPTKYATLFNDFTSFSSADWVATATGAATQALTAGDGGILLITNTAGNNDVVGIQKTPAMLNFTAGKRSFFKTVLKVNDATKSQVIAGVQVINVDPTTATDGIYFNKALASTNIDVICRKDTTTGSTTATAVATMADNTYVTLAWYYDGVSRVYFAINGTVLVSLDASATYLPDATNLAPVFFLKNGEAVAKNMSVDYFYYAKER